MRNEEEKIEEFENDPVSRLLGGLKRVDAPGDFDFRVKARIASGRPVDRSTSWFPAAARFAVPLGLLLLIGGYFGFNGLYPAVDVDSPAVAEMKVAGIVPALPVSSDLPPALPANNVLPDRTSEKAPETVAKNEPAPKEKRIGRTEPVLRPPGGYSKDISLGISDKPLERVTRISARIVLSQIGINASYSGSSWKVGSVKQNSRAERSGVKSGDVIEAVDGQNLTEKTTFENKSSSKSIRILRDGKSMQIDLKP